ncbi:hypothetical protein DL768_001875 [Monosporascus sp. mg162]|nr:hypothetical protein DL768_001875 [Monosporascus sp. mg162]
MRTQRSSAVPNPSRWSGRLARPVASRQPRARSSLAPTRSPTSNFQRASQLQVQARERSDLVATFKSSAERVQSPGGTFRLKEGWAAWVRVPGNRTPGTDDLWCLLSPLCAGPPVRGQPLGSRSGPIARDRPKRESPGSAGDTPLRNV